MRHFLLLATLLSLLACGGGKGPSESCTESSECDVDLVCIALMNSAGGMCTGSPGSACSIACTTDAECTSLEVGLSCVSQCDGTTLCARLAM